MNKNRIRLTESQLHNIIKESVKKVLKEGDEEMGTLRPWNGISHPNAIRFDKEGYGYNSKGELVYHPNMSAEYYPNRLDDVPFDVMSESKLHRVIKESVKRVLIESDDSDIPTSWKEHDNGIATYNRYGKNIGDYTFDAPYYGDSEDSQNRRRESHMAYKFAHNGKNLDDVHNRNAWEEMINNPLHSAHDFVHGDDDATFVRLGSRYSLNDGDIWNGVNEPQKPSRDKELERALSSADKRSLHRKGSLNRELD